MIQGACASTECKYSGAKHYLEATADKENNVKYYHLRALKIQ